MIIPLEDRASSRSARERSRRSTLRPYELTHVARSSSFSSVVSLWDVIRSLSAAALPRSFSNSLDLILRSLTGSRSGRPSGNRRMTSFSDLATPTRASGGVISWGMKMRTAEIRSISEREMVNTLYDLSFSSRSFPCRTGRQWRMVPLHSNPTLEASSFMASSPSVLPSKWRSIHGSNTSRVCNGPPASTAAFPAEPPEPAPALYLYAFRTPHP
mmetsp:Transcript_37795/g.82822  ORF Transcript_37795/g.82822 Transcript_37795/m.82822 type:complete len:214 (+) Transcript_37795:511-1152(+)